MAQGAAEEYFLQYPYPGCTYQTIDWRNLPYRKATSIYILLLLVLSGSLAFIDL